MKHKNLNKILMVFFIVMVTLFPSEMEAAGEDYSAGFRVFKYGDYYKSIAENPDDYNLTDPEELAYYVEQNQIAGINAFIDDLKNGNVEEITSETALNPGDTFVVGVTLKLSGSSANASTFALYYRYDSSLLEIADVIHNPGSSGVIIAPTKVSPIFDSSIIRNGGVFPNLGKWNVDNLNVDESIGRVTVQFRDFNSNPKFYTYKDAENMPFAYVVFKVKDSAKSGDPIKFEYIYESGTETLGSDQYGNPRYVERVDSSILSVAAKAASNDTTLDTLSVKSGATEYILTPIFTSGSATTEYSTIVPNGVSSVEIAATMSTPGSILLGGLGTKNLNVGDNTFSFTATAEDGTTQVYTINIKRLNNDTKLDTLTLDGITFTFNPNTYTYSLNAPYKTSSTSVSATLPSGSKATIDSGTGSWNLSVIGGVNTRKVIVKAEDCAYNTSQVPGNTCTTGEYTLNVTRSNPNNDATLSALNVNGSLINGFVSSTESYTLPEVGNDVNSINVTATPTDLNATVNGEGIKTLQIGENTFSIIVTAEDGVTQKTYIVKIKKKSNVATLETLNVTSTPQGDLNEPTTPNDRNYYYLYDESVTTVTINATATSPAVVTSGTGTFNVSDGKVLVVVTAEDGTVQNYTVNFVRKTSSDKSLLSLKVSNGGTDYEISPDLADNQFVYSVTIPHDVTSVDVLATPKSDRASITAGNGTVNNIAFETVSRTITVRAEDNSTQNYTLNINRQKSDNANLTDIKVNNVSVNGFDKDTINYTLPDVNGNVNNLQLTFTKENQYSTVVTTGNTLIDGNNQIKLTVTAQDGKTTKVYTLNVRRKSSIAKLDSLTVTSNPQGVLSPAFSSDKKSYNFVYDESVSSVNISATAIGNATIVSGLGEHNLASGNSVSVVVEAEDGTTNTYTITFNRKLSTDSRLASLSVTNGTDSYIVTPSVQDGVTNYSVTIPHDITSVNVSATAKSDHASIVSGQGLVDNIGFTPINRSIVIKAEDTLSTSTYVLTINREKSNNAHLSSINLDGNMLTGFNKDTLEYNLLPVDSNVTTLNLTYTKENQYSNATIVAGTNNLVIGENTVIIRVVSQDGTETNEYKIHVKRKSNDATLSGLTITSTPQGEYTPVFNKNTKEYIYKYDRSVNSVVVNATVDGNKSVTGNGTYNIPDTKEVILEVTAEDDNIKETYKIKFEQLLETDSSLKSLTVSHGSDTFNLTPNFNPSLKNYSLTVEGDVDEVLIEAEANGNYVKSVTGIGTTSLVSGGNTKTIVVTAEDGSTTTYTLNITRKINTNATVNDITIGGETIEGFDPTIATYILDDVPYDTTTLDFGATPTPGASLSGDIGVQNLDVGDNTFEINVTAEDGVTTGKYTIKVRRKSNDYSLSDITVTSSPVSTVRKDINGDYTIDVPSEVSILSINPILNHTNATVTNLSDLSNIDITNLAYIDIDVTAEDELYSGTHRVKINKLKSVNVYLSSLTVDQGTLSPVFNKEVISYTVNVGTDVNSITLTASPEDNKATISGDGVKTLKPGQNTFVITVTAEDNVTTKDYTVVVNKEQKSILTLSDLTIDGVTIDNFSPSTTTYTITVPYSKNEITIEATATDKDANISGQGLGKHNLTNNSETFSFIVTAEDGSTQTYQVTVNKENPESDNTLSDLSVDGYTLSPEFTPDEENYNIGKVSEDVDSLTINALPESDKSTIKYKVNGQEVTLTDNKLDIPSDLGPGTIEVIVTAEDGTSKTYTIRYEKSDGSDEGLDKIISAKKSDGLADIHTIDEKFILTGRPGLDINDFKIEFLNPTDELYLYDNEGNLVTSGIIKTSMVMKLERNSQVLDSKIIVIKADVNGDGNVKINDAMKISNHLNKSSIIENEAYLKAADVNGDGNVKINDAMKISNHLNKSSLLEW